MIDRRSLSAVCLLAACTLGCQDVTRSESDLPGTYVLEMVDDQLLPVQGDGWAKDCRITGGTLALDAAGRFTLRDALDCRSLSYTSLANIYGGGLVPDAIDQVGQTGTYTSAGASLALHFDEPVDPFLIAPEYVTAPYSSEAIALDPTRFYRDTIARRRVYIRQRGIGSDTVTN